MRASHEITMATGARAGSSYLKGIMADELIGQNKLDEAESWLNDAFELIQHQGERLWEGEVLRIQARLFSKRGATPDTVLAALQHSIDTSVEIGNRPFALRAALAMYDQDNGSEKAVEIIRKILTSYVVPDSTLEYQRANDISEGVITA